MFDENEMYRNLAAALPWEVQSALLEIRDANEDERTARVPDEVFMALWELQLINSDACRLELSRLGTHLVDYCTC